MDFCAGTVLSPVLNRFMVLVVGRSVFCNTSTEYCHHVFGCLTSSSEGNLNVSQSKQCVSWYTDNCYICKSWNNLNTCSFFTSHRMPVMFVKSLTASKIVSILISRSIFSLNGLYRRWKFSLMFLMKPVLFQQ